MNNLALATPRLALLDISDNALAFCRNSATLSAYQNAARKFNTFLDDNGVSLNALNNQVLKAYKEAELRRGIKSKTIANQLQMIRKVLKEQPEFKYNLAFQMLVDQLFKPLVKFSEQRLITKNKYLTAQEARSLVNKTAGSRKSKYAIMLEFAIKTGLRISELIGIKKTDLIPYDQEHYLFAVVGKGNKQRPCKIEKWIADKAICDFNSKVYLFETGTGTPYNRSNLYQAFRILGVEAGLGKKVGCHTTRHTYAKLALASKKMSLKQVSESLGHSDISVTTVYTGDDEFLEITGAVEF